MPFDSRKKSLEISLYVQSHGSELCHSRLFKLIEKVMGVKGQKCELTNMACLSRLARLKSLLSNPAPNLKIVSHPKKVTALHVCKIPQLLNGPPLSRTNCEGSVEKS